MASRMDRYYKTELVSRERSSKNRSLYEEIDDFDQYSNIEGIANIQNSNEIDINKVKEMLKKNNEYNNKRRYKEILSNEVNDDDIDYDSSYEPKNYDLSSALSKVKEKKSNDKYRSLTDEQYKALKSAKDTTYDISKEEKELKELIHTLYASKTEIQNKLNNTSFGSDDDVGLFDDLKSDTMVGDAASIKSIIDKEKMNTEDDKEEIDNSFYTKSFGFTSSDFEELKDINHKIKKGNKYIIILLVILLLAIVAVLSIVLLPNFFNFNF